MIVGVNDIGRCIGIHKVGPFTKKLLEKKLQLHLSTFIPPLKLNKDVCLEYISITEKRDVIIIKIKPQDEWIGESVKSFVIDNSNKLKEVSPRECVTTIKQDIMELVKTKFCVK